MEQMHLVIQILNIMYLLIFYLKNSRVCVRYGRKVRDNFVFDISWKLLDRFQQINSHFKAQVE